MWYDYQQILSHNILMNFILSNRGGGKTYGFKKWAIKDFLKTGRQFIYLRRYKTEFKEKGEFFKDIIKNNEFPDHELEVIGYKIYVDKKLAGYLIALSTALTLKSTSFPDVNKVCFDEFVIDSKIIHYMHNEVIAFLEFFETVGRIRDTTTAIFLANTVSIVNPYFLYFNIKPNPNKRFNKYPQIMVEFFTDPEFQAAKRKTRFGQLIAGTKYGDYAIDNKYLKDNANFVEKRSPYSRYQFSVLYNTKEYGFWLDMNAGIIHVSQDVDPSFKLKYCLTNEDHSPNLLLIKTARKSHNLNLAITAYEHGLMRFQDMEIKNQCVEIFGVL